MIKIEVDGLSEILYILYKPFKFNTILSKLVKRLVDYAASITHVDTGAWRSAHRTSVFDDFAEVYIDPGATNPKRGTPVSVYASIWELRGGNLSAYSRTASEIGGGILGEFEIAVATDIFG